MRILLRTLLTASICISSLFLSGQEKAKVTGKILNAINQPIEFANISVLGYPGGTISDSKGNFSLAVPSGKRFILTVSFIGYRRESLSMKLAPGETREINLILQQVATELENVEIIDRQVRNTNLIRLDPKIATKIPTISGGIEEMLKTMPGVSSTNELSSQYSVRGGNYDENLVYVNDIEIYRPFLIRASQQEGLSFVNSALVSSILFSAGGFEAKYGDKMSSVLDIQYKRPVSFGASVNLSLLGAQAHVEGSPGNKRFGYLVGARYKTNKYILKGLQTKGAYEPNFGDVQTLFLYDVNPKLKISFLGNYSLNSYKLVPEDRETNFGTINEAYRLKIFFEGQEIDRYETMMGALSVNYRPMKDLNLKFITSAFQTYETETYDLLGQYWIGRLETGMGEEQFGDVVEVQGVGSYLDHARNSLQASVFTFQHKGARERDNQYLQWGVKYQYEVINDQLSEWELIDSAGFSIPSVPFSVGSPNPRNPEFDLFYSLKSDDINISSSRFTGFVQNAWRFFPAEKGRLNTTLGLRYNYWDMNGQFLVSPRGSISYKPMWESDVLFRVSAGYYYQPPFYKEMRDLQGNINKNIKAQKSIHFVAGLDWNLKMWDRPFKFITEAYYKYMDDLIPYIIDNVRIRYLADNSAQGFAYGLDMKLNGEFINGVESWASLSLLRTAEKIEGSREGYTPRPTDQLLNFALFFQDYIPNNPSYSMYLKLLYGTGLPFAQPGGGSFSDDNRFPSYKRVDIGFSKQIISEASSFKSKNPLKYFKELWINLEVLNLFQIRNTISYLWIKDVNGRQYGIPNYLTPRQLNVKLMASF